MSCVDDYLNQLAAVDACGASVAVLQLPGYNLPNQVIQVITKFRIAQMKYRTDKTMGWNVASPILHSKCQGSRSLVALWADSETRGARR